MRRPARAEIIGLSYREYTFEILERGRYLSLPDDAARVAKIKVQRPRRRALSMQNAILFVTTVLIWGSTRIAIS